MGAPLIAAQAARENQPSAGVWLDDGPAGSAAASGVAAPSAIADAVRAGLHIHIPTPGDHYSPTTGSATMTLIYEMTRRHVEHGGQSRVVVAPGTRRGYDVGDRVEVPFPSAPTPAHRCLDIAAGWLGRDRGFGARYYAPAAAAIEPEFDGPVFVHNDPSGVIPLRRRRPRARICLWANNSLFRTYSRPEVHRVIDACDRVLCCSEFLAGELRSRLSRGHERVRVVHNGADTDYFAPPPPEQRPRPDVPLILFVGRVQPIKGPDLLLRAVQKLHAGSHRRKFKVRIVGSSGFDAKDPLSRYERYLRRLAAPMGDTVEFVGFTDRHHILAHYHAASIFCAPSNWDEPCSLTVPEGLACGLPTIASRRGGIPEVGGDAVLYFDPPDVTALADRFAYLLDNPEARAEWGRRARARSAASSWKRLYRTFADVLAS
jgi:glycosyltransferase involved in cell wall biosynthesis